MPVPKKRRSYTKRHKRRSHHALTQITYSTCQTCGEPVLPHRLCSQCGNYKGKRMIATAE